MGGSNTAGTDSDTGEAGTGGAGSSGVDSGGAAGAAEPEGCSTREDCENENADPTNCDVDCDTSGPMGQCVYSARDVDGDGYTSAACARAPGDDCDDTTLLVSPGSTETCDGRDNDCDGYADGLDATIELAGSPVLVRRSTAVEIPDLRRIDITWHNDGFFLVADGNDDPSYKSIYSGYAHTDGSVALYDGVTLETDNSMRLYHSPRVTSLNGTLAMVWFTDGYSGPGAGFAILDDEGTLASSSGSVGGRPGDITHDASSFITASTNTAHDAFHFASGSTAGTVSNPVTRDNMPGTVHYQNAAQSGSVTGVVYTDTSESQPSVQLMRLASGVMLGPTELAQPAQIGDIATLPSGDFAMAWATPAGFKLQVRGNAGTTVVCEAPETAFGNGTLDELDSVSVAHSSLGILVFAADAGGTTGEAAAFVFSQDCTPLTETGKQMFDRNLHTYEGDLPHLPRIAVGGGYVAFAWTVLNSSDRFTSYVRVVPEALCE